MRTCCKRGYLGGSVIEKKSRLVGLEFAHVKCMYVFAFHNAQRIPVRKLLVLVRRIGLLAHLLRDSQLKSYWSVKSFADGKIILVYSDVLRFEKKKGKREREKDLFRQTRSIEEKKLHNN